MRNAMSNEKKKNRKKNSVSGKPSGVCVCDTIDPFNVPRISYCTDNIHLIPI